MRSIPSECAAYKRTPTFTETSIPAGLLNAHQTKAGTWGRIVVLEGALLYRILEPEVQEYRLTADSPGVVEPEVLHEVKPVNKVTFYVEFFR